MALGSQVTEAHWNLGAWQQGRLSNQAELTPRKPHSAVYLRLCGWRPPLGQLGLWTCLQPGRASQVGAACATMLPPQLGVANQQVPHQGDTGGCPPVTSGCAWLLPFLDTFSLFFFFFCTSCPLQSREYISKSPAWSEGGKCFP